ncbi:MAG TPA: 16S rRNA (guanine(966)-N(2))-methyltransferase RsmD [Jatrophihabitantaceae bacterium]|nr:16S rRNA (guanine(966)-N(2))-methyltransferase RsmD [Jatrophihabitantaceae bacterium]
MRIVAGAAKGRRLAVPAKGTRPTSERAREALFNSLRSLLDVEGARVLDLFAGSGAVGLEALSRGAAAATFVESDRAAAAVLRRNVATVGLPGASVLARPAASVLAGEPEAQFDLVFADPPYALPDGDLDVLLRRLVGGGWLAADAVLIVERSARDEPLTWPESVAPVMNRRYGEGQLWYGRPR